MRFLSALKNDVHYQITYGFYFLYAFFSIVYIAVLLICPQEYRPMVASIIILTDPAMLGAFFIGGIWLLEKGEGLHGFLEISPLRPMEYITSKAISLAGISTLSSTLIVAIGLNGIINYPIIIGSVFFSSIIFTIIGLLVASYARSINHYMLLITPIEIILTVPSIFAAFGLTYPLLDVLPGMALWRVITNGMGQTGYFNMWHYVILGLWLCLVLLLANKRIPTAMQMEEGEKA